MAHMGFMFVDAEMEGLLQYILELGFELIPDLRYQKPEPLRCTTQKEVLKYAPDEPGWFLVRDDISKLPLSMHHTGGDPRGTYTISQREGGPTIDLFWSGVREVEGIRFVRPGNISHYPSVWNPAKQEYENVPDRLREAFRQLTGYIRRNSVENERPPRHRVMRIGKEAARQWADGLQLGWESRITRPKKVPK